MTDVTLPRCTSSSIDLNLNRVFGGHDQHSQVLLRLYRQAVTELSHLRQRLDGRVTDLPIMSSVASVLDAGNQYISIQATGTVRRASCTPSCFCACHQQRCLKSSRPLRQVLGFLFAGYSGLPRLAPDCNENTCWRRSTAIATKEITYHFPSWFIARVLSSSFSIIPLCGPQPNPHMPRVINCTESRLFYFACQGRTRRIQKLFMRGVASPYDVNEIGWSALHVSSSYIWFHVPNHVQ